MPIWSAEIKELEKLYESFKGQLPELEKELGKLIKTDDENIILVYSRRCLEVIITDLCECELKRPRKTEPLKGIIDKLNKEEKVPSNIITSMDHLNSLSAYGAHPKDFDPEQVKPVLNNLDIIIKWYLKYKDTKANLKTEAEEVKDDIKVPDDLAEKIQKSKKRLIILFSGLTLIIAIVVVTLFVFDIIGGRSHIKELEKSIAVLPFINDSPSDSNQYFINGLMEEILNNLQTIKDFRVLSRTSTEQYRGESKPPIPEIAKQLGVNYIVEGSGEKYGNTIRLRVQLLEINRGRESHMWGESYEQDISEARDYFHIQSRIAQSIAVELKSIITPEEKQLLEKIPTSDLTAYDFYLRGREEIVKSSFYGENQGSRITAKKYFLKALEFDSSFAASYAGLAWVYLFEDEYKNLEENTLIDSALLLVNKALSYDDQLADAYIARGEYYRREGRYTQAIQDNEKAIEINPNDWWAYSNLGYLYAHSLFEFEPAFEYFQKSLLFERGELMGLILTDIGITFRVSGFFDQARSYFQKVLELSGDTLAYIGHLAINESYIGNYPERLRLEKQLFKRDSSSVENFFMGEAYRENEQYDRSLYHYEVCLNSKQEVNISLIDSWYRIGYVYWKNDLKESASECFTRQVEICERAIETKSDYFATGRATYALAGIYAFRGDKIKAYENLKLFSSKNRFTSEMITLFKNDPLFDSIRDEPEFQQIVSEIEAKYQAKHERVRKWLEENNML